MKPRLKILSVAGALLVSACSGVGSGNIVTEHRALPSFDSLDVSSGVDLELTVDPDAEQTVTVTFDDNLLGNVTTEVRGDTLVVELDGSFRLFGGGRFVSVTMNSLENVEASGGSDVNGSGTVESYSVRASGGADVDLRDLVARVVVVDVSGGADVNVYASESAEGTASGGADVTIHGDPANARVDSSGGADVDFAG